MVSREKIHKLLDLVLDIHDRGCGERGFPFISIEFSNYGHAIRLCGNTEGFSSGNGFDINTVIETNSDADCAISIVEELLEKVRDRS